MAAQGDTESKAIWYGEHLGRDRGWDLNGDARLTLLLARLAGQETAWDRLIARVANVIGLAIAVGGAGLAALVSEEEPPTTWEWVVVALMAATLAAVVGCGIWQYRSRTLFAGPGPATLTEWSQWEGARERWAEILGEAIERNRATLEQARKMANAMLDFLLLETAFAAALTMVVLLQK